MKKFEVLEAHLGDKFYKPGDEETGFRIAEPNEVQHLVDLGLLKLVGDADDTENRSRYAHFAYANSEDGVTDFTTEAPGDRRYVGFVLSYSPDELTEPGQYEWSMFARPLSDDGLSAQPVTNPDDAKTIADLRGQVETLTTERDAARTEVEAASKKAEKPSTGRAQGAE